MKRMNAMWMSGLFAFAAMTGCSEEPTESPPVPEEKPAAPPPKVEIPAYEPTGDFAAEKKEAAAGIDQDNATARAGALEAKLDAALAELKPAGGAASPAAAAAPAEEEAAPDEGADEEGETEE